MLKHTLVAVADVVIVGNAFTVITTVDVAAAHGPAPSGSFVVNVRVTVPFAMLGV